MPHVIDLSRHSIATNKHNVFLLWDGQVPAPSVLAQIQVCLRSLKLFAPERNLYLFSNVLPSSAIADDVHLVRWTYEDLSAGTVLEGSMPRGDMDWCLWSDLFRVVCLWRWGGTYLDVDDIVIRPLPTVTTVENVMAACFLTARAMAAWPEDATIIGELAEQPGVVACDTKFRFGADPIVNVCPGNPFMSKWLESIAFANPQDWGQRLPSRLFAAEAVWARQHIRPVNWPELLYHPYDGGHHPDDKRYPGARIHTGMECDEADAKKYWHTLLDSYNFFLVKNHMFNQQELRRPHTLLSWVVRQLHDR